MRKSSKLCRLENYATNNSLLRNYRTHLDAVSNSPSIAALLSEQLLNAAIRLLSEGTQPHFIAENNTQCLRKLLFEILHKINYTDHIKSL